jgi:hypothetical protein
MADMLEKAREALTATTKLAESYAERAADEDTRRIMKEAWLAGSGAGYYQGRSHGYDLAKQQLQDWPAERDGAVAFCNKLAAENEKLRTALLEACDRWEGWTRESNPRVRSDDLDAFRKLARSET